MFDPRKTAVVELADIARYRREQRIAEIKVYLKALLIAGGILAIAIWLIVEGFK